MAASAGIEIAGGFIGKQDGGVGGESPGNSHPLLLATGELARVVAHARPQPHPLQKGFGLLPGPRLPLQLQRQHHIFQGGERGQQLERLEYETHVAAPEQGAPVFIQFTQVGITYHHPAAAGLIETGQQPEQGRLARAGGADNCHGLTRLDFQRDPFQYFEFGSRHRDPLLEILDFDH